MPVARGPRPAREDEELKREEQEKKLDRAAKQLEKELTGLVSNYSGVLEDIAKRDKKLADLNKRLMKENAKYFSKAASEFADNSVELKREIGTLKAIDVSQNLKKHFDTLVGISEKATTATVAELKDLRLQSLKTLSVLTELAQIEEDIDFEPALKLGRQQLQLLNENTGILNSISENIGSFMGSLSGAVVGVAASSPVAALGVQALVDHSDTKKEEDRQGVLFEIESVKEARADNLKKEAKAIDDLSLDFSDRAYEVLDRFGLADNQDEMAGNLINVVSRLDLLNNTSEETKSLFSSWIGKQEEERREAMDRHKDMLEVLRGIGAGPQKKEKDKSLAGEIATGVLGGSLLKKLFTAGFWGGLIAGIFGWLRNTFVPGLIGFVTKQLPKFLIRAVFLPLMLVNGLIDGFVDAWDKWKETGSLWEALKEGMLSFVETVSFGFLDRESMGKAIDAIRETWDAIWGDIKKEWGIHGDTITEMAVSGLKTLGPFLYDNTIGKYMESINKLSGMFSEMKWTKNIQDAASFVVMKTEDFMYQAGSAMDDLKNSSIVSGGFFAQMGKDTAMELKNYKEHWETAMLGATDFFKFLGEKLGSMKEIFIESIRRLPGMAKFMTEENAGLRVAVEIDAVNYNRLGKSEILDMSKLRQLDAEQIKDLMDFDDWNREDRRRLKDLFYEKMADSGQQLSAEIIPFPTRSIPEPDEPKVEYTKPSPKAQVIEETMTQLKTMAAQKKRAEIEQKRAQDAERARANSRGSVNISNSSSNVNNIVDTGHPYDQTDIFRIQHALNWFTG